MKKRSQALFKHLYLKQPKRKKMRKITHNEIGRSNKKIIIF